MEIRLPKIDLETNETPSEAELLARRVIATDASSEKAYVAAHILAVKILISQGRLKDADGKRVERARRYAKWRYRAFLAGEVAGL